MTILITKSSKTETAAGIEATVNKTQGAVYITAHGLQVLCMNASHRAWRGGGKHFPTVDAALAGYKSGEMKAIIQAAWDHYTGKAAA